MSVACGEPFLAGPARGQHRAFRRALHLRSRRPGGTDKIERIENVDLLRLGEMLGGFAPLRKDHRQNPLLVGLPPLAGVVYDVAIGRPRQRLSDAEQRIKRRPETASAVPTKLEFMEIRVEVLLPEAMERPESPALQIRALRLLGKCFRFGMPS